MGGAAQDVGQDVGDLSFECGWLFHLRVLRHFVGMVPHVPGDIVNDIKMNIFRVSQTIATTIR